MHALTAADAGGGALFVRKGINAHGGRHAGGELVVVVAGEEIRNVQFHRTSVAAVAAGSAGDAFLEALRDVEKSAALRIGQRPLIAEGVKVILHLKNLVHAGEDDRDTRKLREETEGVGGIARLFACLTGLLMELQKLCGLGFGEDRQFAAAAGLHDPDAETVVNDDLIFFLCILQSPVEVVELNLDKIKYPLILCEEALQKVGTSVEGEAEVSDLSLLLHLQDIRNDVVFLALIDLYGPLGDVVEEVEIEIVGSAFFEGEIEERNVVDRGTQGMSRELVGDIVAVPGIAGERFRHCELRFSAEIGVGGVEIVHALPDRQVEHGVYLLLIDLSRGGVRGKAHAAEAEL